MDNNIKRRSNRIILLVSIFLVLIANYYFVITNEFGYVGYSTSYYSIFKMMIIFLYTLFMICLSRFIKKDFYKLVYSIVLILYFFGQAIYYLFNDSSFILVFLISMPLVSIIIADLFDGKKTLSRRTISLKDKTTRAFFIMLAILAIAPYLRYLNTVNLKNLLLIDIYETRNLMRGYDRGILGYLFSPLSRTVFPFLFVYGYTNKRKMITLVSIIGITLLFLLNGAVKSVFLGMFAAIIFIKGDYLFKEKYFLRIFQTINILGLLSYWFFKNNLINDYLRRVIIVPAGLFNTYYNFFEKNYTYFAHSKIFSLFQGKSPYDIPIGRYVGEYVIGREGLNANVGIFVEGFLSFGLIGVILFSLLFSIILIYLRKVNFSSEYFGIFFAYIYIINTSFLEPLFVTHGLLFFLIFVYLFFPKKNVNLDSAL